MKNTTLPILVILCLSVITGFSRQANPAPQKGDKKSETVKSKSGKEGLRKVTQHRDWDVDVNIDEAQIENTINIEVDRAIRTVNEVLKDLDIRMESFEIDIPEIDIELDEMIDLADIDVDIDVDIDDDFDFDFDFDVDEDFDFDFDIDVDIDIDDDFDFEDDGSYRSQGLIKVYGNDDKEKDKEKLKDKSEKEKDKLEKQLKDKIKDKEEKQEKDKSKGLKKIN